MKQVLISGGAGFIGANVAQHHLAQGHRVVILDNFSRKGCLQNLAWLRANRRAGELVVLSGDIRLIDKRLQSELEASDALFHFAAQVAVTTSVADPVHDFEVNARGTFNLLELVRKSQGKKPVVFYASTNKVYGNLEGVKVTEARNAYSLQDLPNGIAENRLLDFHSPYGCSKGAADQYVLDYARIYDLQTVVFRQSCIYGRRQFGIEDQGWVAWFVIAAVLDRPLTIYGTGKQVRDVLFVDDLIEAFDLAWAKIDQASGQAYNIGGGPKNSISLLTLLDYLKKEVNALLDVRYADWRPGDQPVYVSDITKAREHLGWTPKIAWTDGVERLVHWVIKNKDIIEETLSIPDEASQLETLQERAREPAPAA
ncbi:MAG: GDP-mannose 4,6-dehydratase [Candidatus Binatia bacterium]